MAVVRVSGDSFSAELVLIEGASGRERIRFPDETLHYQIALAPDSQLLLTPGPLAGGELPPPTGAIVWDSRTGKKLRQLDAGLVTCFAFSRDGKTLATGGQDGTVLLWDVTRFRAKFSLPPNLDDDTLWTDLSADAPAAYGTILMLSQLGDRGVQLLRARLKPAVAVDGKHVTQLLTDLENPKLPVREKAQAELAALHDRIADALKARLKTTQSAEARRVIQRLLDKLDGFLSEPERLREVRAVEALERINSPAARQLLEDLAKGDPAARLTREAKSALAFIANQTK